MTSNDETPPVAADDFPEFAAPPKHKPRHVAEPSKDEADDGAGSQQGAVDDVIARLRRERAEGKR